MKELWQERGPSDKCGDLVDTSHHSTVPFYPPRHGTPLGPLLVTHVHPPSSILSLWHSSGVLVPLDPLASIPSDTLKCWHGHQNSFFHLCFFFFFVIVWTFTFLLIKHSTFHCFYYIVFLQLMITHIHKDCYWKTSFNETFYTCHFKPVNAEGRTSILVASRNASLHFQKKWIL